MTRRVHLRGLLFGSAAAVALLSAPVQAQQQQQPIKMQFDIKPQSLASALNAFGVQTKQPILYTPDLAAGKSSAGVSGLLDSATALNRLLAGTGLVAREANGTILVMRDNSAPKRSGAELPPNDQAALRPTRAADFNEIIVTANKRAERLADVPASVTALNTASLVENGTLKVEDYAARVPGLAVTKNQAAGGGNAVVIRGISTGNANNPTVGINVDDVPFGSSTLFGGGNMIPDFDPADLDRIEVLRGPQGTLYGAGSMGGLIKFVTRSPDFTRLSGRVQLDGSTVASGGEGFGLRGSVNVPVNDKVAFRASAFRRKDGGFVDDAQSGRKDINANYVEGGRLALAVRPVDGVEVKFSAMQQHFRADGFSSVYADSATLRLVDPDLVTHRTPGTNFSSSVNTIYAIDLTAQLGFATLNSITSYNRTRFASDVDYTPTLGPIIAGLFGQPNGAAGIHSSIGGNKFTQEVRLTSPAEQTLAWQVGVFYTNERSRVDQLIGTFDGRTGGKLTPPLPLLLLGGATGRFEDVAVFGNATYKITSDFDVTAGMRYSSNDQKGVTTVTGLLGGGTGAQPQSSSDSSLTFLVTPRYRFHENLMAYARFASGYRPGGSNLGVAGTQSKYDPDRVMNYEAGLKAELFDKKLSFDVAAFYIDWSDIQIRLIDAGTGTNYFSNAGAAHSTGLEGSFTWRPLAGLELAGNAALTQAELDKDSPAPSYGRKGDRLPDAPRFSAYLSADYDFALFGDWRGSVGASWRYVGDRVSDFETGPTVPRFSLPSYSTVDLRAGMRLEDWSINAFLTNVADKRGYLSSFDVGNKRAVSLNTPRTFGVTTALRF